jgi:hypothetical protein
MQSKCLPDLPAHHPLSRSATTPAPKMPLGARNHTRGTSMVQGQGRTAVSGHTLVHVPVHTWVPSLVASILVPDLATVHLVPWHHHVLLCDPAAGRGRLRQAHLILHLCHHGKVLILMLLRARDSLVCCATKESIEPRAVGWTRRAVPRLLFHVGCPNGQPCVVAWRSGKRCRTVAVRRAHC